MLNRYAFAFLLLAAVAHSASAQFSLGFLGTAGFPKLNNNGAVLGAGVNLRVFTSPRFAVGAAVKVMTDVYETAPQSSSPSYGRVGALLPLTATVDYYLSTGVVRPYIGADAGLYYGRFVYKSGSSESIVNTSNAGFAPRLGLVFALGNLGIFAEGTYQVILGNRSGALVNNTQNIDWRIAGSFPALNAGVIFGFGGK